MQVSRSNYSKEAKSLPKYKYSFNSKLYDLTLSNSSLNSKIGATRAKDPTIVTLPEKIKSNASFSFDRTTNKSLANLDRLSISTSKKDKGKPK